MTKNELLHSSNQLLNDALRVLAAKAAYSTDTDALSGLKADAEVSRAVGLDMGLATHRCLSEIIKKVRRLVYVESQGFPKGADSAADSVIDIINYAALYSGLVKEACDGKTKTAAG